MSFIMMNVIKHHMKQIKNLWHYFTLVPISYEHFSITNASEKRGDSKQKEVTQMLSYLCIWTFSSSPFSERKGSFLAKQSKTLTILMFIIHYWIWQRVFNSLTKHNCVTTNITPTRISKFCFLYDLLFSYIYIEIYIIIFITSFFGSPPAGKTNKRLA